MRFVLFCSLVSLFCLGCSGLRRSEEKKLRQNNLTLMAVAALQVEPPATLQPSSAALPSYPWDEKWIGAHRRITREFFRCLGSAPSFCLIQDKERDCRGIDEHSLPVKDHQEFIYPILIKLLNYLQTTTEKRVVITCGHRCPRHNSYADPSWKNRTSKHQIGAEVDFYVEGMEERPDQVIELLLSYYRTQTSDPCTRTFVRTSRHGTRTPSWTNREVSLTLSAADERRDLDNHHPYPYLTIEVLYDTATKSRVAYSWQQAHQGYFRR